MQSYVPGVGEVPRDLSEISEEELKRWRRTLYGQKQKHRREMDNIDTELIGIKEELRKRNERTLAEQSLPRNYTKD